MYTGDYVRIFMYMYVCTYICMYVCVYEMCVYENVISH